MMGGMSTGERRLPALDGVRGVAILLVVAAHTFEPAVRYGGVVGVTLFFVLSGFLITGLLLREHDTNGGVDYRRFYVRRARRLFPALAVVLAATPVLMWLVRDPRLGEYPGWASAVVLYVGNYVRAGGDYLGPLSHTWSLAVEEQFYLVWPLVLVVALVRLSPRRLAVWLWGAAAVGLVWRLAAGVVVGVEWAYFSLDTNAFGLLAGAALAAKARAGGALWLSRVGGTLPLVGLVLLAVAPFAAIRPVVAPAAGVLAVAVIAGHAHAREGLLTTPVMRWFGSVSYGWYLWHQLLMTLLIGGYLPGLGGRLAAAVLSLGVAYLSLTLVERPVLRRGQVARTSSTPMMAASAP